MFYYYYKNKIKLLLKDRPKKTGQTIFLNINLNSNTIGL